MFPPIREIHFACRVITYVVLVVGDVVVVPVVVVVGLI